MRSCGFKSHLPHESTVNLENQGLPFFILTSTCRKFYSGVYAEFLSRQIPFSAEMRKNHNLLCQNFLYTEKSSPETPFVKISGVWKRTTYYSSTSKGLSFANFSSSQFIRSATFNKRPYSVACVESSGLNCTSVG